MPRFTVTDQAKDHKVTAQSHLRAAEKYAQRTIRQEPFLVAVRLTGEPQGSGTWEIRDTRGSRKLMLIHVAQDN